MVSLGSLTTSLLVMAAKPFTPKEAREILESLQQPAVFLNMASDWPGLQWSVEHLSHVLGEKAIRFRIGKRGECRTPLFETHCSYIEASVWEFLAWSKGQSCLSSGPFFAYPLSEYWAYADYKYIAMLLKDNATMFEDVVWSDFGYPGRNGRESTLWMGTNGANTPCHLDSYGCNLVLQVQGRKKWYLFPPEDTDCLYPTRIPYEESSVFSQVNVVHPDHRRFPAFAGARARVVTLKPGQVLFVPRHWWHYVESVDSVTVSVNSWIEMEADDEARVGEALTRTIVCALKSAPSQDNTDNWLNPTEAGVSPHEDNLQYLRLAVQACAGKWRAPSPERPVLHLGKRDARGQPREGAAPAGDGRTSTFAIPFGPHLVPVALDAGQLQKPGARASNVDPSRSDDCERCPRDREEVDMPKREGARGTNLGDGEHMDGTAPRPISTNDVLEVLVHPDIIAHVTRLLMARHNAGHCE